MKRLHTLALTLALSLCACLIPVRAAETAWLISAAVPAREFADLQGAWCAAEADTVCRAGLMQGKTADRFDAAGPLTHAQITAIAARLFGRLTGTEVPAAAKGEAWWQPADTLLLARIPALSDAQWYGEGRALPNAACSREHFFRLLAAVLEAAEVQLPQINDVWDTPDSSDQTLIQFCRWGILQGKDEYGTLYGEQPLTRGAAAAMLARLIDPDLRVAFQPKSFELCRLLLDADPEEPMLTLNGTVITAGEFMPLLVGSASAYNHSHFAAMMMAEQGLTPVDNAVADLWDGLLCEQLVDELSLSVPPMQEANTRALTHGITEHGRAWSAYYDALRMAVHQAVPWSAFPTVPDPEVVWLISIPADLSHTVEALPYWGGHN